MPVFDKHKLIFHHIPKTAGRAVTEWLGQADAHIGHLPVMFMEMQLDSWETYNGLLPDRKSYKTFTVLRDPLERIRSAFEHIKATDEDDLGENGLLRTEYSENFDGTFENFLLKENIVDLVMSENATMLYPLTWMFCDITQDPKNPIVHAPDLVLSFDSLENDLLYLSEKMNLGIRKDFKLKRTNYPPQNLSARAWGRARSLWDWDFKIYDFFLNNFHIKNIL